MTDTSATFTV